MGICYSNTTNIDLKTNIRYGIISTNLLPSWIWDELYPADLSCYNCGSEDFTESDESYDVLICDKCGQVLYMDQVDTVWIYDKNGYQLKLDEHNSLWIFKSPFKALGNHASPCAPGSVTFPGDEDYGYALGPDWFDEEYPMPYEVVRCEE